MGCLKGDRFSTIEVWFSVTLNGGKWKMKEKRPLKNVRRGRGKEKRSLPVEENKMGWGGQFLRSVREEIHSTFYTERNRTAITVLKEDHERLQGLINQLKSAERGRMELVRMLEEEIKIHSECEEKILYPEMRKVDSALIAEALEEHYQVDTILTELKEMTEEGEAFDAKITVLEETLAHHIREEEGEMFPKAEKKLDDRLEKLGAEIESLKGALTPKIRKAA